MTTINTPSILVTKKGTVPEAWECFDGLATVDCEFMQGRWRGKEIETGHPMNGYLAAANWYGKEFIDPETVHPLLFSDNFGNLIKVAPNPTAMDWLIKLPVVKNEALKPLLTFTNTLLKTEASQARLRPMEYRGKVSATMIYDYLPILDTFRKIDADNVLGVMDNKLMPEPFFFLLTRVN